MIDPLSYLPMIQLDDPKCFVKVLDLEVQWAHSYADMRPGKTDRERRENFRTAAAGKIAQHLGVKWWAFRIFVQKSGRLLDVDNVAKTIIDSFCICQIRDDVSPHLGVGLFEDDTFEFVRILQVVGRRASHDLTRIEIFGCVADREGFP
jgi:hypothetical protein